MWPTAAISIAEFCPYSITASRHKAAIHNAKISAIRITGSGQEQLLGLMWNLAVNQSVGHPGLTGNPTFVLDQDMAASLPEDSSEIFCCSVRKVCPQA